MIVDIIVAAILLISGILALSMGLVKFILLIASWLGAAFATLYGYTHVKPIFAEFIKENLFIDIAAAATLFLVSLVVLTVVTHLIANRVRGSVLGHLDRALGFVFGLILGTTLVSMLYLISASFFWDEDNPPKQVAEAKTLPVVKTGAQILLSVLPEGIFESVEKGDTLEDAVEGIEDTVKDYGKKQIDQLGEKIDSLEAEEQFNNLVQPKPGEKEEPAAGEEDKEPDYDEKQRQDMQRLFDSNQ